MNWVVIEDKPERLCDYIVTILKKNNDDIVVAPLINMVAPDFKNALAQTLIQKQFPNNYALFQENPTYVAKASEEVSAWIEQRRLTVFPVTTKIRFVKFIKVLTKCRKELLVILDCLLLTADSRSSIQTVEDVFGDPPPTDCSILNAWSNFFKTPDHLTYVASYTASEKKWTTPSSVFIGNNYNATSGAEPVIIGAKTEWDKNFAKYHPCPEISKIIGYYVANEVKAYNHDLLEHGAKLDSVSINSGDDAKALLQLNSQEPCVSAAVWDSGFIKSEKQVCLGVLRQVVKLMNFYPVPEWPLGVLDSMIWSLPCRPGILFLLSLRAFIDVVSKQQGFKPVKHIRFFQTDMGEARSPYKMTGVTISLEAGESSLASDIARNLTTLLPAEHLLFRLRQKLEDENQPLKSRGVSWALYCLFFCHVDGIVEEKLPSNEWKSVFNCKDSVLSNKFVQPRQCIQCHASGSDLTLFWPTQLTKGGLAESIVSVTD